MRANLNLCGLRHLGVLFAVLLAPIAAPAAAAPPARCTKVVLTGQAAAGQQWRQPIGQGWVFRLVPVVPGNASYTGWDLVVDRDPPAGYPDALLLATPPWDSINQREIATTFGLRAQDALGWNPRTFRFLTDPALFHTSRQQFLEMIRPAGMSPSASAGPSTPGAPAQPAAPWMLGLVRHSSPGQFRILSARIAPGTADPAPFAQNWALQSAHTPHSTDVSPATGPTPRGAIESIDFSITLWLPVPWRAPAGLHPTLAPCEQ